MVVSVSWIIARELSRPRPRSFLCSHLRQLHLKPFHSCCARSWPSFPRVFNTFRCSVFQVPWPRAWPLLRASKRTLWWKRGASSGFILSLLGWRLAACQFPHLVACKSKPQSGRVHNYGSDEDKEGSVSKFSWAKLWEILSPDIVLLLLAAAVRTSLHLHTCIIVVSLFLPPSLTLTTVCLLVS